jgi:hypothetical protein
MRLTKSLLPVAAALALVSGAAFAGDSMSSQSHEASPPELLSDAGAWEQPWNPSYPLNGSENAMEMAESDLGEADVIYVYPIEVTEYYILVPSTDTEMPRG